MNKKRIRILFSCVLGIFISFFLYIFVMPMNKNQKIIEIIPGDRLSIVAEKLYSEEIINSKFLFMLWMYLSWDQNNLKLGEYSIPEGATLSQIQGIITSGRMYNKYITIPEGLTVKQIFEIINSYDDLTGNISVSVKDGELLPQTYAYNKMITKDDLILKMKQAMSEVIDKEWKNRQENLPIKTKEEAIILASIVEKETGIPEERPLVASVFINRLNKKMRLQSDPTVVYTLTNKYGNMRGRRLYKKDLEVVTPYNTYKINGLPIGAIANPGIDSIRAVLNPAETDFLYFVADGSGGHKFAKTLEEHEKNRQEWKKIRDKTSGF